MSIKNWTTKNFRIAQSGETINVRVDDPDTPIVVSVTNGTLNASVVSSVDGVTLETLNLSAPGGISILSPGTVFGNFLTFTAAADATEFTVLKEF